MKPVLALSTLVFLAGCATPPPSGPSVMVLPGSGKSFDQFRYDDFECRQYASSQVGGTSAADAQTNSAVKSAAVGTAVGAAAGGLIGGNSGAGVGAGVGLAAGALAGTDTSARSGYSLQQRYDISYTQCMYAKGHKVPVSGRFTSSSERPQQAKRTSYVAPPPPPPSATQ